MSYNFGIYTVRHALSRTLCRFHTACTTYPSWQYSNQGIEHFLRARNVVKGARCFYTSKQDKCTTKNDYNQRFKRICNTDKKDSKDDVEIELDSGERMKENIDPKKNNLTENILTIPNILTASRMVVTPIIGYAVLQESYYVAAGLFVYAGLSDLLDGYIARAYPSQKTVFGSFLDPLADKLLISTLYVTLTMAHLVPVPLTALIISRDIGLILAAFYIRYVSLPPPKTLSRYFDLTYVTAKLYPTVISKVNTGIQFGLVAVTLLAPIFQFIDGPFLHGIWYLTASTTMLSGMSYVLSKNTYKIIKSSKHTTEE